jgi:hypothetical protein
VLGYVRYDSQAAVDAINDLFADLRLLQNLCLPSVKLMEKRRVGAKVRRRYDAPRTPFERLRQGGKGDAARVRSIACARIWIRSPSPRGSIASWSESTGWPIIGRNRRHQSGRWTVPAPWTPKARPHGPWKTAKSAVSHTDHRHHRPSVR